MTERIPAELPEVRVVLPETWPSVEQVVVDGTRLFYRLGPAMPLRDTAGRHRRDGRGRVALEAFMALPRAAMYERLAGYLSSRAGGVEADEVGNRAALSELLAFVDAFGPLGLTWSRMYHVENPEADRLAEENDRLRLEALGLDRAPGRRSTLGTDVWRVSLPKPGESGRGRVERVRTYPELSWDERVRLGDEKLLHDDLGVAQGGAFVWAHVVLEAVLGLADALARANPIEVRRALEKVPRYHAYWVGSEPAESSLALDWRPTAKGVIPSDRWFKPFMEHPAQVDWVALGWRVLAEVLLLELSETGIGVGLPGGRLKLGWRIGSLMEVIYLQLFEHMQRHPDFGIGSCDGCGAPILRVRREQRWHSGCAPAGRQRESRAARKLRDRTKGDKKGGLPS